MKYSKNLNLYLPELTDPIEIDNFNSNFQTIDSYIPQWNIGSNPNLLDNWYFLDPVNQKGLLTYTGSQLTIDRWHLNGGTLNLNSGVSFDIGYVLFQQMDGINLDDGILRCVSYIDDAGIVYSGPLTAGYTQYGQYSFCYNKGEALYIKSESNNHKIVAVKLETGAISTLAYQLSSRYVLRDSFNKTLELLKCQKYYWESKFCYVSNDLYSGNNRYLHCNVRFPTTMRVAPQITITSAMGTPNMISLWNDLSDAGLEAHVAVNSLNIDGFNTICTDKVMETGISYAFRVVATANL